MKYLEMLKSTGLKATPQRICVLKALSGHTHPSIDELYAQIKKEHPSISLATVYKNLSTLVDENLVVEISMPNQKSRYDIYEEEHIHVVCKHCGAVYDMFSKDAKMHEYQHHLENKIGASLNRLNIVATTNNCKNCSTVSATA